jgi:hypothetical protein
MFGGKWLYGEGLQRKIADPLALASFYHVYFYAKPPFSVKPLRTKML